MLSRTFKGEQPVVSLSYCRQVESMEGAAVLWLDMLNGVLLGFPKTATAFWKIYVNEHTHHGMHLVSANLYSFLGNRLEVRTKTN